MEVVAWARSLEDERKEARTISSALLGLLDPVEGDVVSTAAEAQVAPNRYVRVTFRSIVEILDLAASFFGLEGVGLGVSDQTPQRVVFAGCGGYVCVSVADGGHSRTVSVDSWKWDVLADVFLRSF